MAESLSSSNLPKRAQVHAVAAGFLIGAASVVFQATLPHDARVFRDAFVYGAVIVVLLVRPQGLFAPKSAKQRV